MRGEVLRLLSALGHKTPQAPQQCKPASSNLTHLLCFTCPCSCALLCPASTQDPFPKPCYLFSLVAGDLAVRESTHTTCSGRTTSIRVYVPAGYVDQVGCQLLEALGQLCGLHVSARSVEEEAGVKQRVDVGSRQRQGLQDPDPERAC